jgi:hypothetical protein
MIPSLSGFLGLPQEQRSCLTKCTIFLVILSVMQLQKWMHMGCKKYGHCSHTFVEDACKVWGHQSGVMQSFAATKERQTSWLGVGTLEMAGQTNVCSNSYCLQRNLRVSLQFCQRQANCIAHCCPCLSSSLVVAVIIVRSSIVIICPLCHCLVGCCVISYHHHQGWVS